MAILQHTAQEIAVLDVVADHAPEGPRRQDVRGLRLPERGARRSRRSSGPTAARATFDTVTLDTAAYEALYDEARRLRDHLRGLGGHRGGPARTSTLRTFKFTDYGFPDFYQVVLACDRGLAGAGPGGREGVRGRDGARASSSPRRARTRPPRSSCAQNPGVFDANPELPVASARLHGRARGCSWTRPASVGAQTLDEWTGYSVVPVRAGPPRRRGGQAADRAAGLRGPCSRTTSCREAPAR